jgi:hypothetical protein
MQKYRPSFLLTVFLQLFLLSANAQAVTEKKLFTTLPSSYTGVKFRNDILENSNLFYYTYEYLYIGGGVGIGDINNDGLSDLYFASTTGFNKLYINLGNCQFKDISESAGIGGELGVKTGVNMIDINADGWLDIVVSKSGPFEPQYRKKIIYINNRDLTFTDKAKAIGLDDASHTTQTYFLDYDKDGDMDAFLINHPVNFKSTNVVNAKMENGKMVMIDDTTTQYFSHRLYENRNGFYTDISKKAGVLSHAFGLSVSIADFNKDGWPDIYVANDFKKPDFLYINNRNGTFSEKLADYFNHISQFSMGSDINDINNDGLEDMFVADMAIEDPVRQKQLFVQHTNYDKFQLMLRFNLFYQYPHNVLQLNNGNGNYSEIGYHAGVAETDWTWAPLIADYDNNGWKDIYITNGLKRDISDWDYREFYMDSIAKLMNKGQSVNLEEWFKNIPSVRIKNYIYHNNGSLQFDNFSDKWSDEPASFSNGAAYADLDNDGDLDMVVNNVDDEAFILRNNLNEKNPSGFIRFRFFTNKDQKQEVYGTIVKLYDKNGNIQLQRYDPQRGYMSSCEHFLHFGIGKETAIARIEIIFPSGKEIVMSNVASGQVLTLFETDGSPSAIVAEKKNILFSETTKDKKFNYIHMEGDFIDFKREPLIPYKCSRKGPYYAKADVNGDGREDIYIGGSSGNEKTLLLQNADESFIKKLQPAFVKDKAFEDGGAVFFDADGDKDADLYVVSGGAEFPAGNALYQDRLYINDGKGSFTRSAKALPGETNNGSCVIAADIDGDNDIDLFVGGAVTPGKFPRHDKNMLLQNNKGIFTDITVQYSPELNSSGIVNAAGWGDVDGDNKNELLLAGEWMPIMIFKTTNGKLVKTDAAVAINDKENKSIATTLNTITGWWNTIKLADIDNDGDLDIVAGNRGLNSRINANLNEPCTIYAKDFDKNGSYDAVLGYYIQGKCYPIYHRDQLIDQMPMMRKKFYRYHLYAGTTLDNLFSEEQQKDMDIYKTNCFASGIFINDGKGNFNFKPLPELAQLSYINDLLIDDFDNDGNKDIIVAGNCFDGDVGTGNYDAMATLFLKGDGKGQFIANVESGLSTKGEVRKIIALQNKTSLILLRNNTSAQVFKKRL